MLKITKNVAGGNIEVLKIEGDDIYVLPEQRDTIPGIHWFYWHFRVEGAQGHTLRFHMGPYPVVGYYGAAMRHANDDWQWTGTPIEDYTGFTYTFGEDECDVEFCHDFHYPPERFMAFAQKIGLQAETLVLAKDGSSIPMYRVGTGDRYIFALSRHHACESTGTYMLEGFVDEYAKHPIEGYQMIVIPFIDYEGVINGDQGKNRAPHDHNRDYLEVPIYPVIRKIMHLAREYLPEYVFDFHSPWHFGDTNDALYAVRKYTDHRKDPAEHAAFAAFGEYLERENADAPEAVRYRQENDQALLDKEGEMPESFATTNTFFMSLGSCRFVWTMEMPYFGGVSNAVSEKEMVQAGRRLTKALAKYHSDR